MSDAPFCLHRHRDRLHDFVDQDGVEHTSHLAIRTDISSEAFKPHHCTAARICNDLCMDRCHHIHNNSALEHLRLTPLKCEGSSLLYHKILLIVVELRFYHSTHNSRRKAV